VVFLFRRMEFPVWLLRRFCDVNISLYYCDASVDGPYSLDGKRKVSFQPLGFGGTSFEPVFEALDALALTGRPDCIVYFTDGYGDFPDKPPPIQTLWLLVDNGISESDVPFGKAIKMQPLAA